MIRFLRRRIRRIDSALLISKVEKTYGPEVIEKVQSFFEDYQDFRTIYACSRSCGLNLDECTLLKRYLYLKRKIGGYVFAPNEPPQKYMHQWIMTRYPALCSDSFILEVGPGDLPVFSPDEFSNWYGVDRNYDASGVIHFAGKTWGQGRYPEERTFKGDWSDLLAALADRPELKGKFDLIVASHSFEHSSCPIASLKQARLALAPKGKIVLFVPDGYSDDPAARSEPTHTMFLVPPMVEEFFQYAGGYKNLEINQFRANYDIVISAENE